VHPESLKDGKDKNHTSSLFYSNDSARKRKLDELVMNMIAVDIQPFRCVEVEGLISLLRETEPRYKLPSRTHLRDTVLPVQYDH